MNWPTVSGTVLVPFDFSDASKEALCVASKFVAKPEQVIALHVVAPLPPMAPGVVWSAYDEAKAAEQARRAIREALDKQQLPTAIAAVQIGDPARAIIDTAEEKSADLIVIPTHGHSGLRRFLLGSVAARVVQHAPCPVLVLRANAQAPPKSG
ncbi:MAG: universal stress protein [Nannocystaceae bacterium]